METKHEEQEATSVQPMEVETKKEEEVAEIDVPQSPNEQGSPKTSPKKGGRKASPKEKKPPTPKEKKPPQKKTPPKPKQAKPPNKKPEPTEVDPNKRTRSKSHTNWSELIYGGDGDKYVEGDQLAVRAPPDSGDLFWLCTLDGFGEDETQLEITWYELKAKEEKEGKDAKDGKDGKEGKEKAPTSLVYVEGDEDDINVETVICKTRLNPASEGGTFLLPQVELKQIRDSLKLEVEESSENEKEFSGEESSKSKEASLDAEDESDDELRERRARGEGVGRGRPRRPSDAKEQGEKRSAAQAGLGAEGGDDANGQAGHGGPQPKPKRTYKKREKKAPQTNSNEGVGSVGLMLQQSGQLNMPHHLAATHEAAHVNPGGYPGDYAANAGLVPNSGNASDLHLQGQHLHLAPSLPKVNSFGALPHPHHIPSLQEQQHHYQQVQQHQHNLQQQMIAGQHNLQQQMIGGPHNLHVQGGANLALHPPMLPVDQQQQLQHQMLMQQYPMNLAPQQQQPAQPQTQPQQI